MDRITDYKNETLEAFWTSLTLDDERFSSYQVDGVLVCLGWSHAGYQHYDASLAVIAPSPGVHVEILKLEIKSYGVLSLRQLDKIQLDQRIEGRDLYRADRVIAVKIDAERLKQISAVNGGRFEAVISVRVCRNGGFAERVLIIPFEEDVRRYLPVR